MVRLFTVRLLVYRTEAPTWGAAIYKHNMLMGRLQPNGTRNGELTIITLKQGGFWRNLFHAIRAMRKVDGEGKDEQGN